MTDFPSSPETATLVHEWQAEAKKHALAALDGDCEVGDEEWCLHRESARIYRKCADQLEAILTAGLAQRPAECPVCNGDCAGANPPVYNCPKDCSHPWAAQDENGRPYCVTCGQPWNVVARTTLRQAEQDARRKTKTAILGALLREARQYVSDAGCDEDSETQRNSSLLLEAIDTALSDTSTDQPVRSRVDREGGWNAARAITDSSPNRGPK